MHLSKLCTILTGLFSTTPFPQNMMPKAGDNMG